MAKASLLAIPLLLLCLALAGGTDAVRKTVGVYKLQNKKGDFSIKVTNWGATLMSVIVTGSKGNLADVVLGYDKLAQYVDYRKVHNVMRVIGSLRKWSDPYLGLQRVQEKWCIAGSLNTVLV